MDNTAMTLLGVIAAPVTVLFGPVAAYNLVLRAGFTLSALAMFVVARRLVRWWPAALVAGLLYGFSPFMVGQGLSHEFLVFAPIPPLVLGVLAEVLGRARWPAWRAGLGLGALFGAQFLIASETFAMMLVFAVTGTALALCYRAVRTRMGHLVRVTAWAAGACTVIIAYPVYFFFAGPQHVVGSPHPLHELRLWHGDLLGAFLPTPLMRFAPPGLLHIGGQLVQGNLQENGTYLGLPLVLIAAGLGIAFRRRPVTAIAGVLAVVSYALSLGARVSVAGHATAIPGPFALLARTPVLQDIEPARFSLFTALFVAIVLGTGLDQIRFPMAAGSTVAEPAGRAAEGPVAAVAALGVDRPVAAAAESSAGTSPGAEPPGAGPPGAGPPGAGPPRSGGLAARVPAGRRRAVLACVMALVALLPLVPRWPYPAGRPVTPRFFTTSAVQRIPPGSLVVTFPYPAQFSNEAMAWQAEASDRFRLLGGSRFFVPGPGGHSVETRHPHLYPRGIDRVFVAAFFGRVPRPGPQPPLLGSLLRAIRADIRRYHISAVLIDPLFGHNPALAIRYVKAATRQEPERVGGILGWFHLDR